MVDVLKWTQNTHDPLLLSLWTGQPLALAVDSGISRSEMTDPTKMVWHPSVLGNPTDKDERDKLGVDVPCRPDRTSQPIRDVWEKTVGEKPTESAFFSNREYETSDLLFPFPYDLTGTWDFMVGDTVTIRTGNDFVVVGFSLNHPETCMHVYEKAKGGGLKMVAPRHAHGHHIKLRDRTVVDWETYLVQVGAQANQEHMTPKDLVSDMGMSLLPPGGHKKGHPVFDFIPHHHRLTCQAVKHRPFPGVTAKIDAPGELGYETFEEASAALWRIYARKKARSRGFGRTIDRILKSTYTATRVSAKNTPARKGHSGQQIAGQSPTTVYQPLYRPEEDVFANLFDSQKPSKEPSPDMTREEEVEMLLEQGL